jgi:DNA polymerase-1
VIYGFDIETNQLNPHIGDPKILTVAWCDERGPDGVVVDHPLCPIGYSIDELLTQPIAKILADPTNTIVGVNLVGFDIPYWEKVTGHKILAQIFDAQVAHSLIDENAEANSLEFLAEKYLGERKNPDGLNRKRLAEADPALVLKYNKHDAWLSYRLYAPMQAELQEHGLEELMRFRMQAARPLIEMSLTGTHVDQAWAAEKRAAIAVEVEAAAADLNASVGTREIIKRRYNRKLKIYESELIHEPWNLGSSTQLAELLYGVMELPVLERTDKGKPSTSEDTLKELRGKVEAPVLQAFLDRLLLVRKLEKLDGTYLEPWTTKHLGNDGRLHTTFKLDGTVTGRLSSAGPNLQNVPRDKRIKGVLAATPGMRMFNADYSQLELRVAAWYSGEPTMLRAFAEGLDVHTLTLAELEGKDYDWVRGRLEAEDEADGKLGLEWTEKRALIKRVNFGVLYGTGAFRLVKLMRSMGIFITQRQAERIIDHWFARYTRMVEWIEETKHIVVQRGYVVTPTGRVRRLPDVDPSTGEGKRALRQGVNFMVQSLAGEIALEAVLELYDFFAEQGGAQLLLTVHDSALGEYFPEDWAAEELTAALKQQMTTNTLAAMERRYKTPLAGIPLAVDVKLGAERWA